MFGRPNLVIVRAGPRSLHTKWVMANVRSFDLLVSAYSEDAPRAGADLWRFIPGTKVAGYAATLEVYPELASRYQSVALIDDDIECCSEAIDRCFQIGLEYNLDIWQPSLTLDSYFSYAVTLNNDLFKLRYTNFIEMMCPFFRSERLVRMRQLYSLGFETGIDLVWCSESEIAQRKLAVIDAVAVKHTRPVGLRAEDQGFDSALGYQPQIDAVLNLYQRRFAVPAALSGVLVNGHLIKSFWLMAILKLRVLAAIPSDAASWKYILRRVFLPPRPSRLSRKLFSRKR